MNRPAARRRPRRPAFDGDFPDGAQSITEAIRQVPDPAPQRPAAPAYQAHARRWDGVVSRLPAPAIPPYHEARDEVVGRSTAHGWPHLFQLTCQYPAAVADTPIPCGRTYADHGARSFTELWRSGQAAGWHLDAFGRIMCPRCCMDSPEYRTLYPVTVWDGHAFRAAQAGDPEAEIALRGAAEWELIADVHEVAARHGRHQRDGAQ